MKGNYKSKLPTLVEVGGATCIAKVCRGDKTTMEGYGPPHSPRTINRAEFCRKIGVRFRFVWQLCDPRSVILPRSAHPVSVIRYQDNSAISELFEPSIVMASCWLSQQAAQCFIRHQQRYWLAPSAEGAIVTQRVV